MMERTKRTKPVKAILQSRAVRRGQAMGCGMVRGTLRDGIRDDGPWQASPPPPPTISVHQHATRFHPVDRDRSVPLRAVARTAGTGLSSVSASRGARTEKRR